MTTPEDEREAPPDTIELVLEEDGWTPYPAGTGDPEAVVYIPAGYTRGGSAAMREALERLVSAKALAGVRALVAGWNGEDRPEPYNERHPSRLGARIETNCGGIYDLDEAMQAAIAALVLPASVAAPVAGVKPGETCPTCGFLVEALPDAVADAVLEAFPASEPVAAPVVTDAMVEAALFVLQAHADGLTAAVVRAAIEAALSARNTNQE